MKTSVHSTQEDDSGGVQVGLSTQTNDHVMLSTLEAATYLGLTASRIRYETFLKRIPHIKLGRSVRFTKAQLDQWVASKKVVPNE